MVCWMFLNCIPDVHLAIPAFLPWETRANADYVDSFINSPINRSKGCGGNYAYCPISSEI